MRQAGLHDAVLLVTQYYSPEAIGSAPYCADLAEGLARRGRPVTVVTGLPHYPHIDEFQAFNSDPPLSQHIAGVVVERLHSWLPGKRSALRRVGAEIMFMLAGVWALLMGRIHRCELVISVCPSIFTVALGLLCAQKNGRHIAVMHDIQSGLARGLGIVRSSFLVHLMQILERLILNRTDLVLVLSEEMATELRELGVTTPIEILPIWVDIDAFPVRSTQAEVGPVIGYSGNFGRKQGLEQIVELAGHLKTLRPDVSFVLRGSGGERETIATAIRQNGLDNVRMEDLLPRERLAEALTAVDIHLVPQKPDGANFAVPSKIYNIMAAGRCFVTTALPGSALWNLQQESQAFLCVPPHDPRALIEAVITLLNDQGLREEMGQRGRQYVERHHAREALLDHVDRMLTVISREGKLPAGQRDFLILEPDQDGHPEEWLRHLLHHIGKQDNVDRIWLVLPPALRERLAENLPTALRSRIRLLELTPKERHYCTHGRLAISGFARWWIMRRYLRRTGARLGYFLALDHLSLPLGIGLRAGQATLGGILFRPSVHYHALGLYEPTLAERIRDWRKAILYRGMLRNPAVSVVLTLDPFFPDFAAEHYPGGDKVQAVPDPAFPAPGISAANDDNLPLELPKNRTIFLLFGVLTERKGVLHLLDALCLLRPEVAGQVAVVIAGKIAPDIQDELEIRRRKLVTSQPNIWIHIENRWLSSVEISTLVRCCDVVLAPYQRFVGSSGVLLWAARAGKPLLTQDYGLVGRLVRDHRLGVTTDVTNLARLADSIADMIASSQSFIDLASAQDFVDQRAPEAFAGQIFSTLRIS